MDVNVEMLDKNGEKFSKDAYEKEKNDRFPKSKRQEFMETHEVEEFLEKVMNI